MAYPYDQAVNPGMGQPQPQINPETGQPFSEAEMAQMAAMLGTIAQQYVGKRQNDKIEKKGGKLRGRIGEQTKSFGLAGLANMNGARPTSVPASIAKPVAPPLSKLKIPEVY